MTTTGEHDLTDDERKMLTLEKVADILRDATNSLNTLVDQYDRKHGEHGTAWKKRIPKADRQLMIKVRSIANIERSLLSMVEWDEYSG